SPPRAYGNKVKTLLTGHALTAEELATLDEDPAALRDMVAGWFDTPEAEISLRHFFEMSFQQNQVANDGLMDMLNTNNLNWGVVEATRETTTTLLIKNIEESFARTALQLVKDGRPFNDVVTTDTFQMTTAMMVLYSYLDFRHVQDDDTFFTRPLPEITGYTALRNQADEPPASEVLDPSSPNFMRIYIPLFDDLCPAANEDEIALPASAAPNKEAMVFFTIMGRPQNLSRRVNGVRCTAANRPRPSLLTFADFNDWRPVRIRPANDANPATKFYDLPDLRGRNVMRLYTPRVGFFTHLGFFGTWPTNEDNSSRVTLNQTLITALGASFDGATVTDFSPPNLDAEHSGPGTPCYGCHQTLDPMRDFFRQSYSSYYGEQHDTDRQALEAIFVFRGVQVTGTGNGVHDLADIVAAHPDLPVAWAQKLCAYANAGRCPDSAELTRVVEAFKASNLNFRTMAIELLSSPLVTNAECVNQVAGVAPSISRRDQFCGILSSRLEVDDVCGLDTNPRARSALQSNMVTGVRSIPADTFSRGEVEPVTIAETGLFTRANREVACTTVGERAFDPAFTGLARADAIDKMVTVVMGIPDGDPRRQGALQILTEHVVDSRAAGANERNALRSALVVACMAPGVAGIGF
ncbi:MAG: hypothetical protein H6730_36270, partial [Deltaproteobacteria bacterium]|nr:hypothetical protein [Deltaproteobacteria bacterium]